MERGIRKCLTFVIRQIAEISEIRNFCLWNPQSWVLQSGLQLKESGIPLTTRNPNASSNTEILGAERIQLLSQIPQLHEAILCCLDQTVYQHNRQSTTKEEMTSFIDSIPIIFCSVSVQLYITVEFKIIKVRTKHLLETASAVTEDCFHCHEIKKNNNKNKKLKPLNERSQEIKCYRRLKNIRHVQASGLCGEQCFSCLPKRFTQVYWWFSLSRHQN